jgi:hypothetical protein
VTLAKSRAHLTQETNATAITTLLINPNLFIQLQTVATHPFEEISGSSGQSWL